MSSNPSEKPVRLGEWVDAKADEFETAWRAVQPPRVAEFLADATEEQRSALLAELSEIDREYRSRLAERAAGHETLSAVSTPSPEESEATICNLQSQIRNSPAGYEILRELGQGGMSVVYLARQTGLKRLVALKMLRAGPDAGSRQRQRLRTEAEAAARLQHPNIVQIHEVGEHDGQLYLALEYVEGGTLADRLAATPQPARQAALLIETLARAMHHAHQQGIVHRDLKPANILLVSGGVVSGGVVGTNEPIPAATTHHSLLTNQRSPTSA
jgi:serine/threonine-protein kinase